MITLDNLSTPSKANKLKVDQLKKALKEHGLPTDGKKAILIERLTECLRSEAEDDKQQEEAKEEENSEEEAPQAQPVLKPVPEEANGTNTTLEESISEIPCAKDLTKDQKGGQETTAEVTNEEPKEATQTEELKPEDEAKETTVEVTNEEPKKATQTEEQNSEDEAKGIKDDQEEPLPEKSSDLPEASVDVPEALDQQPVPEKSSDLPESTPVDLPGPSDQEVVEKPSDLPELAPVDGVGPPNEQPVPEKTSDVPESATVDTSKSPDPQTCDSPESAPVDVTGPSDQQAIPENPSDLPEPAPVEGQEQPISEKPTDLPESETGMAPEEAQQPGKEKECKDEKTSRDERERDRDRDRDRKKRSRDRDRDRDHGRDRDRDRDRKRSDRDRDRDRDRKRSGRERDRDRDRGRDSKRSDRDRDRKRDRKSSRHSSSRKEGDRGEGGRDRDRDRDRGRDRKRSRRSGSRDRDRGKERKRSSESGHTSSKKKKKTSGNWDKPPELGELSAAAAQNPAIALLASAGVVLPGTIPPPPVPSSALPQVNPASILGAAGALPVGAPGATQQPALPPNTQVVRQARRLYVGNIPVGLSEATLLELFNQKMTEAGKTSSTGLPPVSTAQINHDKSFAFIEFQTPEDATNGMVFDGLMCAGNALKVRRPKDYRPIPGVPSEPKPEEHVAGIVSTNVPDSEHKIFLGGLPQNLTEPQVRELVAAFGELRAFNLVKDAGAPLSKGYCFFEFMDTSNSDRAIEGLNGLQIGDRAIVCQRANANTKHQTAAGLEQLMKLPGGIMGVLGAALGQQVPGVPLPGSAMPPNPGQTPATAPQPTAPPPQAPAAPVPPSKILRLDNMVTLEELNSEEDYDDIMEDVRDECGTYGTVISVKIPRPDPDVPPEAQPGVGQIFVQFDDISGASKALEALHGRQFAGRTVEGTFFDEEKYSSGDLS